MTTINELLLNLPKHVECTWAEYTASTKDANTLYFVSDKNLIYKGNTLYSGNTSGEGVINDSTIMPFEGYLPDDAVVIEESTSSTNGEILYDQSNNRFIFKDISQQRMLYYANWSESYLYNKLDAFPTKARNDKLFYYNNTHYIVINGVLSDLSEILKYVNNAVNETLESAKEYTDSEIVQCKSWTNTQILGYVDNAVSETLESAKEYTDSEIVQCKSWTNDLITNLLNLKIQYLQNQAAYDAITPIEGVLYLIGDE